MPRAAGAAARRRCAQNVKAPLVYVKVAVRNWQPVGRASACTRSTNPMGFYSRVKLDYPVSLGDYRFPRTPDEPMVLHLVHVPRPEAPGRRPAHALARRPRAALTPCRSTTSSSTRATSSRACSAPAGSTGDRDVAAITVNRWGHGYSYSGSSLYDREGDDERIPAPRASESDASRSPTATPGWDPYAHAAFDQADRAVDELLGTTAPAKPR